MSYFKKLIKDSGINKGSYINVYTVLVLAFVVWISFFDRYSLISQYKLSKMITTLEDQKQEYEELLDEAIIERDIINSDIEKYGREKYLFHKPNEEIIIIK